MLRKLYSYSLLWYWVPPILWMGLIFFLSSRPDLPHYPDALVDHVLKKAGHVAEYAILAFLYLRALSEKPRRIRIQPLLGSFVLSSLYALSDEYHQTFVPGRNGDLVDMIIDALGALAALLAIHLRRGAKEEDST